MDVLSSIEARRTIREYDHNYVIPKEHIEAIANHALMAPSACGFQGCDVYVIQNPEIAAKIEQKSLESVDPKAVPFFKKRYEELGVKNCITCDCQAFFMVVKNERADERYVYVDAGIMAESIMLAAVSLGYVTMPVGAVMYSDLSDTLPVKKGDIIMAVAVAKGVEHPTIPPKPIKAKVHYY